MYLVDLSNTLLALGQNSFDQDVQDTLVKVQFKLVEDTTIFLSSTFHYILLQYH